MPSVQWKLPGMLPKRLEQRLETWDLPQECERHHMSGNSVRMRMKCIHRLGWNKLGHFLTNFWGVLSPYKASFFPRLYRVCQLSTSFFMDNLNLELAVRNSHYSCEVQLKTYYTVNASIHHLCLYYVSVVTLRLIRNCPHQPNLLKQVSSGSSHFGFLLCSSL